MMAEAPPPIILGIREESRPKGHGYLYWRRGKDTAHNRLCDVDLYDIRDDIVAALFKKALTTVIRELGYSSSDIAAMSVVTENMSAVAKGAMLHEVEKLSKEARVSGASA